MKSTVRSRPSRRIAPASTARRPGFFAPDTWLWVSGLVLLSVVLQCLIFAPISFWPLAYLCMTPWLLLVAASNRPRRVYVASFGVGFLFHLVTLSWIWDVTGPGYVALAAYIALYFPLIACPLRHWARRRRLPLAVGFPILWVASEYVRGWALTGFPWFFLSHSQYSFLSLIQVSDLVGAYGVSFIVAAINGAAADLVLSRARPDPDGGAEHKPRGVRGGVIFAAILAVGALVYGQVQLRRACHTPGPRIAVIQGDYPLYLADDPNPKSPAQKAAKYFDLIDQAAAHQPDLVLLPETPWSMCLNAECIDHLPADPWSRECYRQFQARAQALQATIVTGAFAREYVPFSLRAEELNYNSAFVFPPDGTAPGRYDKNHLVVFGESVPFRYGKLRFLYLWLQRFIPFAAGGYEYSLTPGREFKTFSIRAASQDRRTYRFGVPICYEDVMPYVSRRFVTGPDGGKQVDFLLNISNDGWFLHSNELPQHLAICAFRAVENRVAIARAVNTGISGFIDSCGRIQDLVKRDGRHHGPGIDGYSVAAVSVDARHSLYSRTGDLFARVCAALLAVLYMDYGFARARPGPVEEGTGLAAT